MRRPTLSILTAGCVLAAACAADRIAAPETAAAAFTAGGVAATPPFNVEALLRPTTGGGSGFGHVKFRQDLDDPFIITLDTWIRDVAPNTVFRLQRAVDATPDDDCNDALSTWLTLGAGLTPLAITTDDRGVGRAALFRNVSAFPAASDFDIVFRVIDDLTGTVVLQSECYQFVIRG